MKTHEYEFIYWDSSSKRFVAVADLKLSDPSSFSRYTRRHYIIVQGKTDSDTKLVAHVQLTDSGLANAVANFKKPKMKLITEYQVRNFFPEFNLDEIDELVDKKSLFVRLSI